MDLQFYRLLFDFGLVVLIWLVQLVIYPSFKYYQSEDLPKWHKHYTLRVSYVVLPLMLAQLIIVGLQLWGSFTFYTISSFIIVLMLWASTFLFFVPLHNQIGTYEFDKTTIKKLVNKNWFRTILWTLLFLISYIKYFR